MSFDFSKNSIRFLSFLFCGIFLLQISIDLCNKLVTKKEKQSSVLIENAENEVENESINDDCEAENELESQFDKITHYQILKMSKNSNSFLLISQSRLIQINLSTGFFRTIIPPPKQNQV